MKRIKTNQKYRKLSRKTKDRKKISKSKRKLQRREGR